MKAKDFDRKFDEGKSVIEDLELAKARRPLEQQKRVNVDIPIWMIRDLDREATRVGVTRQSIIKIWLAERLEQLKKDRSANACESKEEVFDNE